MDNNKVLLVEDDKFLREILAQKISAQQMEIQAATDGANALEILKTFKPNLIILDLLLPDIDGFGVLAKIKENTDLAKIPVVVLSNLDKPEDMQKAQDLGAKDFMVKSNFSINEIVNKAKEMLGK